MDKEELFMGNKKLEGENKKMEQELNNCYVRQCYTKQRHIFASVENDLIELAHYEQE